MVLPRFFPLKRQSNRCGQSGDCVIILAIKE